MDSSQDRIEKLRKLIAYHRALYYTFDAPEITDAVFDSLIHELESLEKKYPQYVIHTSPTQRIGDKPLEVFVKAIHEFPMFSFSDAFSKDEIHAWIERVEKHIHTKLYREKTSSSQAPFYCELKIDGLAIDLVYDHGLLTQAITRGDGRVGEDVTQNILTISDIPQKLEQLGAWVIPEHVVIRGEVFISKKELERINTEQIAEGKKPYVNTRNLAAGSLRQLDPAITASRKLMSFQYDIVSPLPISVDTHEQYHHILASWGCTINPHNKTAYTLEDIYTIQSIWEKKRDTLSYEIDGIVVLLNDNMLFNRAGVVGRAPRGAIAYKFIPYEATTIVEDVRIQVGRTGVLTPVALLQPVFVGGVTISHATLHNFDEIERLGVRIGDTVAIVRSGDVIPKITQVFTQLRTGKEKKISLPTVCPIDGSVLSREGVFIKCTNKKCGARNRNNIIHFVSRAAFDIRGLGKKIIDRFLDEGLIGDVGDIFSLDAADIMILDRFGEKSAQNLIQEIQQSKSITVDRFLYALGIAQVGEETARVLAHRMEKDIRQKDVSISHIARQGREYTRETLQELSDVGPKVAESIYEWFHDVHNQSILKKLADAGIVIRKQKQSKHGVFSGKTFCITGTLTTMSRPHAKELLEKEGGVFHSTITKGISVIVVGADAGSKLKKAQELGIEIWNEEEFLKKLT
ncbi:MAG: NAD-dependent DNA ligase LigA [Candidatus Paceibacterota bacterium]